MSFWSKCAPGSADQSLQVSRFSLKRSTFWPKKAKMTKIGYMLNFKVAWRLDQLLSSNLLKTVFPLKLTISKCLRKLQCKGLSNSSPIKLPELWHQILVNNYYLHCPMPNQTIFAGCKQRVERTYIFFFSIWTSSPIKLSKRSWKVLVGLSIFLISADKL